MTTRMKRAINPTVFAVGKPTKRSNFMVRVIAWGYTLARDAARDDEEIREAYIMVAPREIER